MSLLEVKNLEASIKTKTGAIHAIEDISFSMEKGEILGVVGESGCGKSLTALSILRLLPTPPIEISGGQILYDGQDLLKMSKASIRSIRGNRISMIFQEPMTSLNPVYTVGNQIMEAIHFHRKVSRKVCWEQAVKMLKMVGIPAPEQRMKEYPHQLSGGMRQRVMIAMALSCQPELLIADEPTTALDVTIQAQILDELKRLQKQTGTAIMLITHDLGVVADMAQKVLVMYAGKVVEYADTIDIFSRPPVIGKYFFKSLISIITRSFMLQPPASVSPYTSNNVLFDCRTPALAVRIPGNTLLHIHSADKSDSPSAFGKGSEPFRQ